MKTRFFSIAALRNFIVCCAQKNWWLGVAIDVRRIEATVTRYQSPYCGVASFSASSAQKMALSVNILL